MKNLFIFLINFYQSYISPDHGIFSRGRKYCVFEPSCSQYIKEAVKYSGILYGIKKGALRIVRCHPWQKQILDPFRP